MQVKIEFCVHMWAYCYSDLLKCNIINPILLVQANFIMLTSSVGVRHLEHSAMRLGQLKQHRCGTR